MKSIITNLKNKPSHIKEQIAIFSALALTAVVAFFWVASLGSKFSNPSTRESFAESLTPFKVLKSNLSAAVADTEENLKSVADENKKAFTPATVDEKGVVNFGEMPK